MEETRQYSIVRQRLRGFGYHLAAYFVAMALLVPFNLLTDPNSPWFVLPLIGWGGVLAAHVAYVMGLFPEKRGHGDDV